MPKPHSGRKNPNPPALKLKLDKKAIAALVAPQVGYSVAWDAGDAPGLGIRIMTSGRKVWFWQGRRAKVTIGRCSLISPEQARKKARELAAEVELGGDPGARRRAEKAARRAKAVKVPVHTMDALWRHYSAGDLKRRRASVQDSYYGTWRRELEPRFASRDVASITEQDLEQMHREVTKDVGAYAANRTLALASVLMAQAVKAKWRPDNPARGVTRNREEGRERYLSPEEVQRLVGVIEAQGDDLAAKAIEFTLLSGARRGEVLGARWADFDLRHGVWTKPSGSTKSGKAHRVPLSKEAAALLAGLPTRAAEAGPFTALPLSQLKRRWAAIRAEAGLEGVRFHDLRHSFASILATGGVSLQVIGAMLGHATPAVTMRYAHLQDEALRKAAAKVGRAVRRAPVSRKRSAGLGRRMPR